MFSFRLRAVVPPIHGLTVNTTGLFFGFLIGIPFVIFLAGFLGPIFKSDREHGEACGVVVSAGALPVGAGACVGDIASAALYLRGEDDLGAEGTRALHDLLAAGYSSTGIAFTILGLGAAMVILKRKVISDWVGWLPALLAVPGPLGLFGMLTSSTRLRALYHVPGVAAGDSSSSGSSGSC